MHEFKKAVAHVSEKAEHWLHVAYLGGVAIGFGYRYAAIGMLVTMALSAVLHSEEV